MKKYYSYLAALACAAVATNANAQLSSNPDKFLGNITTSGQVNPTGIEFADLWNQITPENESKWSSIEGTRNNYNWWGCDNCYNYARQHNFPFKFHTLVWGSQYPTWITSLGKSTQYSEIVEWYDKVKERYPDLDIIDVVNEAIAGHAPAPFKDALGGDGVTGYDWIIKAFELAHERWPNAILIYNDYNTFQWQKREFIDLVKTIRDAGAPIDAYGCQSHDLTDMDFSTFKSAMIEIQNALKMPMYSTEYDIGTSDDAKQKKQYSDQIKYMWEQDYCAGITLWGYIYGRTWTTDGNSGIIKNGADRPAMAWLRDYMASDAAKTAKSPYKNFKKEASIYIKPEYYLCAEGESNLITVEATLATKTIEKVELYINDALAASMTEAPYEIDYTADGKKPVKLKAIVYDTEGNSYERLGGYKVVPPRSPFKNEVVELPGFVQAENFDVCGDGFSYHDSDNVNEGDAKDYRTDSQGVDIGKGGTGYVVGYTATSEWLEYTVDVTEDRIRRFEAYASTGIEDGAEFTVSLLENGSFTNLATVKVPYTGGWDKYQSITGRLNQILPMGRQTLRITITRPYVNIDYVGFVLKSGISDLAMDGDNQYDVYATTGVKIGTIVEDDDTLLPSRLYQLTNHAGIYLVRNTKSGESKMIKAKP